MNKYKEAFTTLTDWFHSYTDSNGVRIHERHITESYEEAKKKIGELVEKATPMKVEVIYLDFGYFDCPKCGNTFCFDGEGFECNYCPDCGQAIDWKAEESSNE